MEHESTVKENEIRKFVTKWMGLQNITLSERTQAKKDKQHFFSDVGPSFKYVVVYVQLKNK